MHPFGSGQVVRPASSRLADDDVEATPAQEVVARVPEDHQRVKRERAEVKAQLVKQAPAWAELQKVLNELNRRLGNA